MFASDARLLMRLWLRAPRAIATAAPSGRAVCRALTVDVPRPGHVDGWIIELGAGTGPVTATLLEPGVSASRLLAVEANTRLHARLCQRFGSQRVACHDATDLTPLFDARGVDRIDAVISTLPILNMPAAAQRAILDACFARAAPQASFTQITYLPGSPVRRRRLHAWGYQAEVARFVWSNLPPSTIWRYTRRCGMNLTPATG
ncbi:class I SAM-dependent methyltransferase [Salinisphaera aquimarina]|uniref:Class I SAM-dependent methyltransferase n=1 Tax=Salinisphaera aquimarina TaxID=2094031 RepID=A0ABV7EP84_9GAMM